LTTAALALVALAGAACSQGMAMGQSGSMGGQNAAMMSPPMGPPPAEYKKVSTLVQLPDFLPGLGTLYVQPSTLPAGPFLAYDRDNKLVSTIYMIPVGDIDAQKKFDNLAVGPDQDVKSVSMYFNAGHPGVPMPHYHIVLWHVPQDEAKLQ
jgi:hypothetical protein